MTIRNNQEVSTPSIGGIERSEAMPPAPIPAGHVGEFVIPGSGRLIWWTGRVAIGLLYQPQRQREALSRSSLWIQDVMI
ncbi:MAG TPA: hypothetical protein VNU71_18620, partial [Burkholderiaceae bacterium]|nr:hypothetical protein [Burkholderiaceae bacterium]